MDSLVVILEGNFSPSFSSNSDGVEAGTSTILTRTIESVGIIGSNVEHITDRRMMGDLFKVEMTSIIIITSTSFTQNWIQLNLVKKSFRRQILQALRKSWTCRNRRGRKRCKA